ncbi:hypothetical protein D9758_005674 [Tetrapyrgos nigripes]|uniref:N-acetyltransferase domain-containing protein n=1 Tax=Tetrapyrgos nigripes TaxID=182062 RepID=A0A8H5LQX9_9AGAR|nr:hypothetical protein D9758_005674 [Tetrapyrgos nigripes]
MLKNTRRIGTFSSTTMQLDFKLVTAPEIEEAVRIEEEGFPPDEAGSLETFRFRQSQAPDLFLGAYTSTSSLTESDSSTSSPSSDQPNLQLIGYVCSTLSLSKTITHASMSTHISHGRSICIHSVCVDKKYRRQGIALRLLKEYISRLQNNSNLYDRILLIAHEELIPLYENAGFTLVGKSEVTHGPRPWFEMRLDLKDEQ